MNPSGYQPNDLPPARPAPPPSAASRPASASPRSVTFIRSFSVCRAASGRLKVTASTGPSSRLRALQLITAKGVSGSSPIAATPVSGVRPNCHHAPADAATTTAAANHPTTFPFAIADRPYVMTRRIILAAGVEWRTNAPGRRRSTHCDGADLPRTTAAIASKLADTGIRPRQCIEGAFLYGSKLARDRSPDRSASRSSGGDGRRA